MLKPTQEWIVVELVEEGEKVTESGIILPGTRDITKKVRLVTFGPDANKTGVLKEGDIVLCMTGHGIKVDYEDKEYQFMKEENFLGLME